MRTTVNLDDDVYEAARSLAASANESLGRALSRLARRGLAPAARSTRRGRGGFPVVTLPAGSPPVTSGAVRRALDDE
jgi:hypothetical protein